MKATRPLLLALLLVPLLAMFQNCSNVAFDKVAEVDSKSIPTTPTDDGGGDDGGGTDGDPTIYNEKFTPASTSSEASLDIIWVVDNSGSMSEEAANVRANLVAFIQAIQQHTDLHLLLISRKGSIGKDVEIPAAYLNQNIAQVNQFIDSKDGPAKMLSVLQSFTAANPSFFRANSSKSIVFVTDDNSSKSAVDTIAGIEMLGGGFKKELTTISAFIGLGKATSPCQAVTGDVYKALAADTGGKTYNICEVDWSNHFANLADSTISKLVRTFQLKDKDAATITSVEVDRKVIDPSKYKFVKGILTLDDSVDLEANSEVVISFKR